MFKCMYDTDVTIFSPEGRIYQMEYAVQAAAQGSVAVGVLGPQFGVLVALQLPMSTLAAPPSKISPLDPKIGFAASGIAMDITKLTKFLRTECGNHRFKYGTPPNMSRLLWDLGHYMQINTQRYDRRPFGAAMLMLSYDDSAKRPRLHFVCSSSTSYACRAFAIGKRAHMARDWLLRNPVSSQPELWGPEALFKLAMDALRNTTVDETEIQQRCLSAAIVGPDQPFRLLNKEEIITLIGEPEAAECSCEDPSTADNTESAMSLDPNELPSVTLQSTEEIMDSIARMMKKVHDQEMLRKKRTVKRKSSGDPSTSSGTDNERSATESSLDTNASRYSEDKSQRSEDRSATSLTFSEDTSHQVGTVSSQDFSDILIREISSSLSDISLVNIADRADAPSDENIVAAPEPGARREEDVSVEDVQESDDFVIVVDEDTAEIRRRNDGDTERAPPKDDKNAKKRNG